MNKILLGTILGIVFGVLDIIPMIFAKTGFKADLSAFIHWVAVGFLIGVVVLPIHSVLKGLLIAVITAVPILLIIDSGHIPVSIITVIFGSLIGFLVGKFGK